MAFPWTVFLTLFVTVILASSQCQGCNQTLRQESGTFASPGFPQNYANGALCSWAIQVERNQIITLSFSEFQLENCGNCGCDYVNVYEGRESGELLLGKYCGNTLPNTTKSTGNRMYIVFRTDRSFTYKGFSAAYQSQSCNQTLSQPNGTFTSPGFPQNYNSGTLCSWTIEADRNHKITLSFSEFELEDATNCRYDYVEVYDGSGPQYPLLGKYCGFTLPNTTISTGNIVHVVFRTDGSNTYNGFSAAYHSQDCIMGRYGPNCTQECNEGCADNECDRETGNCLHGCVDGYTGDKCNDCLDGRYGSDCSLTCPKNCNPAHCLRDTGYCTGCVDGYYGNKCENRCNQNCEKSLCNQDNGICSDGCIDGYVPPECEYVCDFGTYGTGCQNNCSQNCKDGDCHPRTGHCDECIDGYTGDICGDEISEDSSNTLVMGVGIGVGAMVVVGIIIVVGVCCYRRRSSPAGKTTKPQDYNETKMDGREENSYTEMHTSDARYNLPTDTPSETVYQNVNAETNRNSTLYANADAIADGNPYEEITEGDAGSTDVFSTTSVSTERSGSGVYVNVGMRK